MSLRRNITRHEKTESRWRDSPIVVGAISIFTTASFMATVVVPLVTSHLSAQIERGQLVQEGLRGEIDRLKSHAADLRKKIDEGTIEQSRLAALEKDSRERIRQMQLESPFASYGEYPSGLDAIPVGSPIDHINGVYGSDKIDKSNDSYWSVSIGHPIFSSVVYYFDERDRIVNFIYFFSNYKGPLKDGDLIKLATARFGKPDVAHERNNIWFTRRSNIAVEAGDYAVFQPDYFPGWFSKGVERGKIVLPRKSPTKNELKASTPASKAK